MKHSICTHAAIVIATLLALPLAAQAPELDKMDVVQRSMPDGPVALVDGNPINKDDYLFLYKSQLARIHLASGGKKLDDSNRINAGIGTLAELVQREILNQLGVRKQISVSQAEVKAAYDKQLETLIKEFTIEGKVPTEEEILKRSGQERAGAMEDMHKALLVEKASKALVKEKGVTVTDQEARDFFDSNKDRFQRPGMLHLKQIFIQAEDNKNKKKARSWSEAEKVIKQVEGRFQVGERFDSIAKSISDGSDADKGGDMGMRPTQSIPPIYVEKAGEMEIGATSAPFKSDQGWHIIRLEGREGASDLKFEDTKVWIKERLMEVKIAAAVEEYCQPILQDENRVQIFLQLRPPNNAQAANNS